MLKDVRQQLSFFLQIDHLKFLKFCKSWKRDSIFKLVISKSFYCIWVTEVSKSKFINRHSQFKNV